jgi:ABC-2 type transport system permease protein
MTPAKWISLYFSFCKTSLKSQFAFRVDAVLRAAAVFVREITGVSVVYLALMRFPSLGGWSLDESMFLFSFLFLTYAILIAVFTGFRDFQEIVYSGELDRFMLRPRGLMFQLISARSDYLATMGHGAVGILLFAIASGRVGIEWNAVKILYLIAALSGGVLIQGSIFVFFSCLDLWFIKADNAFSAIFWNARRFAGYPLSIFPKVVQSLLIFAVPFAFVTYFPAQFFLRKSDLAGYWEGFVFMSPLVAAVLFAATYAFWRLSLKKYMSVGN